MRTTLALIALAAMVAAAPTLRIDDTQVYLDAAKRQLLADGTVSVTNDPAKWYQVYFQVCGPDQKPLKVAGKTLLLKAKR